MKLFLSVMALIISVVPLNASELPGGFFYDSSTCFERKYSSQHLQKHPQQRVSMIRFEHFPKIWGMIGDDDKVNPRLSPGRIHYRILVRFRDSKKIGSNTGECESANGKLQCYLECDAGKFQFIREGANKALIRNQGFSVPGCDTGEEESGGWVNPKPDDKAFRLYRLPKSQCRQPLVTRGN